MTDQRGRTVDSAQLGGVIRARRAEKGLTIAMISTRTGLSSSFLSQLENGRTNSSLRSLQTIADALSTTAAEMLAQADRNDAAVTRADDASLALSAADGGAPSSRSVRVRSLVHGPRVLRALEFTGSADDDREFSHLHDEILYVVSGAVVTTVGAPPEIEHLDAGDSLYITAGTVHRWRGLTAGTKVVLVSVSEDRRITRA